MTVLDKLKSLLGIDSGSTQRRRGNVGVTVEQAPDEGNGTGGEASEAPATAAESAAADSSAADSSAAESSAAESSAAEPATDESATSEPATDERATGESSATTAESAGSETEAGDNETAASDRTTEEESALGTDEPTDVIKGIGPSYAETLADAGIDDVADLAVAEPDDLEAETGLSAKRLERWIGRARNR